MIYDIFPFKDFNPSLIPRLQENFRRIQHAFNHLQSRYFQHEPIWDAKQDPIYQGLTPPENPKEGTFWLDTSQTPNVLYRWSNGQWVKATPTEAAEVGAEKAITKGPNPPQNPSVGDLWIDTSQTPNVLHVWNGLTWVKASPTSPEDVGAEPRIVRDSTPPPNPAVNAIWIDTSVNPPIWRRWTGSAWEKMTRTDFAELYGQITGEQIAPDSITPTHIAWLDASLITTGTMLFNRIRGGTAELGGSGNGNGLLIVRDASGNERARLDNAGITVTDANFLLRESRSNTIQSIVAATNLVADHSFEMIPRSGSADADQTFAVDETYMGNLFWWQTVPGSSPLTPRVLSTYDTDYPQLALFDFQAAVVRHHSRYAWRQYVPIDQAAGYAGSYTLSAFFSAFTATSSDTTAYAEVYAVDYTLSRLQNMGTLTVSISASEKWKWKRGVVSFSNIPQSTSYLEIFIYSNPDVPILCDGVQLVPLPYPVVYNPESAVWRAQRGLAGYTNVENIYVPPSIRITRTSNFSVPNSTAVSVPWQGRVAGYNSAGMWNPSQPNPERIYIPETGKYLVICTVRWQAGTGGTYRLAAIKVNGGNNIAKVQEAAPAGNPTYQQVSAMAHLNAGDYIEIVVVQNNGGALNLELEADTAPMLQVIKIA